MASVAQLDIKYCNLQLDELQTIIAKRETNCFWWTKFSPHISRLSGKIAKLASLGNISGLEERLEQFKNQLMQKHLRNPSQCTFAQCRAIKREIDGLKTENITEIQFVGLIVLEREQASLLGVVGKSYQKHVARRPKKPIVDLYSLENWRRPPSTDSESSMRSSKHSAGSDSDTRGSCGKKSKGKYVYRTKK